MLKLILTDILINLMMMTIICIIFIFFLRKKTIKKTTEKNIIVNDMMNNKNLYELEMLRKKIELSKFLKDPSLLDENDNINNNKIDINNYNDKNVVNEIKNKELYLISKIFKI
jgi:competence protein ComGC